MSDEAIVKVVHAIAWSIVFIFMFWFGRNKP
jgi:hypothetical protein